MGGNSVGMFGNGDGLPPGLWINYPGTTGNGLSGDIEGVTGLNTPPAVVTSTTDFNGNGTVDTYLQGPNGQVNRVILDVYQGQIFFDNLYNPVSVQIDPIGNWIVGAVADNGVIVYSSSANRLWTIPTTLATFIAGSPGSAYKDPVTNNVICALPAGTNGKGTLLVITNEVATNTLIPIVTLPFNGNVTRALPGTAVDYWIAVDDVSGNGQSSRIMNVNSAGTVLFSWGTGILLHPVGLKILPNSDILISE